MVVMQVKRIIGLFQELAVPAKKWTQTRKLKNIKLNTAEVWVSVLSGAALVIAAVIEAFVLCAS